MEAFTQTNIDEAVEGFKKLALETFEEHGSAAMAMVKDRDFMAALSTYELDMRPALLSQGFTVPTASELLGVNTTITERK
ncbi:hypothetical protein NVP1009O_37 [Vibrio phage 1.009.O._10N.261.51.C9]|nr:hypothetical protein NVP1009O_37 [Vibrio phage 1.009.O._10N.261.51.C9]